MGYVALKRKLFPFLDDLRLFFRRDSSDEKNADRYTPSTSNSTNETKMSFWQKFLLMCLVSPYLFLLSGRIIFKTGTNWPIDDDAESFTSV
jgi:hypothetical protein